MKYIIGLTVGLLCSTAFGEDGGYLFTTFKGEGSPTGEQIHFALSKDGRNWHALNNRNPVLISDIGEKGVRDPYILRAHDNTGFYLIATDLSVHNIKHDWGRAVRAGSRNIVVWKSKDLVSWSAPALHAVAPKDAGCTWAPEAIYDRESGDYLVFWASTTGRDDFSKHRIWGARTQDFESFGEPFVYIEKPTTIIDTTIVYDDGKYYRFTKDEQFKAISMETGDSITGTWSDVPEFSLAKLTGYEGPACFQLKARSDDEAADWCLIIDHYARGRGYIPFVTRELAGGQFEEAAGFDFPFRFRHGSVLTLSEAEYERLESATWKPTAVDSEE